MKNISASRFFLIFAIFFGVIFSVITPPFQVADEINHFYRAYQISEGNFNALKVDNRVGGYIPKSIVAFTSKFRQFTLNKYNKITLKELLSERKRELNPSDKIFIDFPNTALYSPVSYAPQAAIIFILRIFKCNPFYILYISRIFTLLFWFAMIYFAIKKIPFQKNLLMLLAFLPMSISTNSSLSADVITNALSFLLIAILLKTAFENKKISYKSLIIISSLVVLLSLAKLIYVSLLFLFLIIPKENFKSIKQHIAFFSVIVLLGFGFALMEKQRIDKIYTSYENYNPSYREATILKKDVDISKQFDYILDHKKKTVKTFVKSVFQEFKPMTRSYIGRLGWGDTQVPDWFVVLCYIFIFFTALFSNYEKINFRPWQRMIFLAVFFILFTLIMLSQYLSWVHVGEDKVYPLQGRYFIPVFPLIFLLLYFKKLRLDKFAIKIELFVFVFAIFICVFSVVFLINRYYHSVEYTNEKVMFCNTEQFNKDSTLLLSSGDFPIEYRADFLSKEYSHSGTYSIKLTQKNQYGFTHAFKNIKKGDKFIVSVWRKGQKGFISYQEDCKAGVYLLSSKIISAENNWIKLQESFIAPKDMTEKGLKIYVWYPGKDSVYFDDLKIRFYKNGN